MCKYSRKPLCVQPSRFSWRSAWCLLAGNGRCPYIILIKGYPAEVNHELPGKRYAVVWSKLPPHSWQGKKNQTLCQIYSVDILKQAADSELFKELGTGSYFHCFLSDVLHTLRTNFIFKCNIFILSILFSLKLGTKCTTIRFYLSMRQLFTSSSSRMAFSEIYLSQLT